MAKTYSKTTNLLLGLALRVLLFAIRITPRTAVGLLAKTISWMTWPISGKDRAKIARNIDHILGISTNSRESSAFQKAVLRHQVESGIESFKSSYNHDLIEVSGLDELKHKIQNLMQSGRGLVIITGHMGSWELAAYYCSLATGEKFNALAKPSKLDTATGLLDAYRQRLNTKTLWTNQRSLLKTMLTTLKQGEALGFVMDQRPDGRKGPLVQFMGQATPFAVGPAWAATRNDSPVLSVFCMREGPWRYRLISTELLPAGHGERDTDILTQRMAGEIERVIRLYPEQWVWNYSRWKFKRT